MNLCNRLMKNQTTKTLLLSMLKESRNSNFINGLLEDDVDILDVFMQERIVIKDNHQLPNEIRKQLERCIKYWDLAEARWNLWKILAEK